jgi:hypothetical protein
VINKDEAATALSDIADASYKAESMQRYQRSAPYFLLWGGIWMLANCLTDLAPAWAGSSWNVLVILGAGITIWLSTRTVQQYAEPMSRQTTGLRNWKYGATWLLIFAYFIANFSFLPHLNGKQGNAYISMFWAFIYAFVGVWTGWRIFVIGLLTAASILIGYFWINTHYFLWMGLVSGSLLMLGGVWLRKV